MVSRLGRVPFVVPLSIALVVFVTDSISKVWAIRCLGPDHDVVVIINDHLCLTLAFDPGARWGHDVRPPFFEGLFFCAIMMLTVGFIFWLNHLLRRHQWVAACGFGLALGSGVSGLHDRISLGSVVNLIDYRAAWVRDVNAFICGFAPHWSLTDHLPTFNLADVAAVFGFLAVAIGLNAIPRYGIGTRRLLWSFRSRRSARGWALRWFAFAIPATVNWAFRVSTAIMTDEAESWRQRSAFGTEAEVLYAARGAEAYDAISGVLTLLWLISLPVSKTSGCVKCPGERASMGERGRGPVCPCDRTRRKR